MSILEVSFHFLLLILPSASSDASADASADTLLTNLIFAILNYKKNENEGLLEPYKVSEDA